MADTRYRARFWRAAIPALLIFWCAAAVTATHLLLEHPGARRWEKAIALHFPHRSKTMEGQRHFYPKARV